jgi:RNA polymerase sigma-70 factor (ECF subfamily)
MDRERHERFVELFVPNQNRVYRFILTLIPNRADADELFQQTNLTMWKNWEAFDPDRDFVRWACGIAHNHVRNFLRKKQNQQVRLSEEVINQLAQLRLEKEDVLEEQRLALADCLKRLPSQQRRLVERCYSGEETIKSVAESDGRSVHVVYKILRRMREILHDCVTRTVAAGADA